MNKAIHFLYLCVLLTLTGCSTDSSADWETMREKANELYNSQQYDEALAVYEQVMAKADNAGKLQVRQDIIDCYQVLGNQTKARELLKVQLTEAHDAGYQDMEAEAMSNLGMQIYDTGDKALGYDYMQKAVALMEQSKASDAPYLLAYYHFILMKRRAQDNDYQQAIHHSQTVEASLAQSEEPEKGEQMLVRSLATRAFLYSVTDSLTKADSIYYVWQKHQPISIASERDICPYLTNRGRYQEVVDIQQRYVNWVRENKGEWTASERTSKYSMAEAEAALGHGDRAYQLMRESYEINDTLIARQAEENAQELEAVYQNHQKTEQISHLRLWVIILGGILALLIVIALVIRIRQQRKRMHVSSSTLPKTLPPPMTTQRQHALPPSTAP